MILGMKFSTLFILIVVGFTAGYIVGRKNRNKSK